MTDQKPDPSKRSPAESAPGFVQTLVDVSLHTTATFDKTLETRSRWPALLFAAAVVGLGSAIGEPLGLALSKAPLGEALFVGLKRALGYAVLVPVSLAVEAAIVHGILWAVGGRRKPLRETINCVGLARAPLILAAIPVIGAFVGGVWAVVVQVRALGRVHGCGWVRPLLASLGPTVALVVLAFGLRAYVVEAFRLGSGSMQPTLLVGDQVFVVKSQGRPQRGDVVLFDYPGEPSQAFLKRAIGLPGDELSVGPDGTLVINGWAVPWCRVGAATLSDPGGTTTRGTICVEYLGRRAYLVLLDDTRAPREEQGPHELAAGEVFVLGDNRENSTDSRRFRSLGEATV